MEYKVDYQPLFKEIKLYRQFLHAHPELSGREIETAAAIVSYLKRFPTVEIIDEIGETGVLAIIKGLTPGPSLLFRAELDALPITETNSFSHRSKVTGIAHKCGHDGHMAMLLGLARLLSEKPLRKGQVILLFQPAEEIGEGAQKIINDPRFLSIPVDYAFALHNMPSFPLHTILFKEGSITAAARSAIFRFHGKETHAASPDLGINPALAISEIILEANKLNEPDESKDSFSIITPIHLEMGKVAYGISAGYGEARFTLRTWTEAQMTLLCQQFENLKKILAQKHEIEIELEWTQVFQANHNAPEAVDLVREAIRKGNFQSRELTFPFRWGEDFGYFTQKFKGALIGIGAGLDTPPLHDPAYDFPDDILYTGVKLLNTIANLVLE